MLSQEVFVGPNTYSQGIWMSGWELTACTWQEAIPKRKQVFKAFWATMLVSDRITLGEITLQTPQFWVNASRSFMHKTALLKWKKESLQQRIRFCTHSREFWQHKLRLIPCPWHVFKKSFSIFIMRSFMWCHIKKGLGDTPHNTFHICIQYMKQEFQPTQNTTNSIFKIIQLQGMW